MRKIISKHEADKKKRRNQLLVGGILIVVMFASVMGYAFQNSIISGTAAGNSTQTVTYNGFDFSSQNGFWILQSGNSRLAFTYNPSEILAANLTNLTKSISDFSGTPLYIYSSDRNATSELSFNMRNFASGVQSSNNTFINPDCSSNTIIIQNGTQSVIQKQNCIYVYGQGEDLIKLTDNIMFKLLGIRQ